MLAGLITSVQELLVDLATGLRLIGIARQLEPGIPHLQTQGRITLLTDRVVTLEADLVIHHEVVLAVVDQVIQAQGLAQVAGLVPHHQDLAQAHVLALHRDHLRVEVHQAEGKIRQF